MSDNITLPDGAELAPQAPAHPDDPNYDGPEFTLRLRDDGAQIFVTGFTKPPLKQGDPLTTPCHMIGAYIATHFGDIVQAAEGWFTGGGDSASDKQPPVPTEPETIPRIEAKAALLEEIEAEARG